MELLEKDDGTAHTADCDEWESGIVGNSDSVSMIALDPKERGNIDSWKAMCEILGLELMTEISDPDSP